MSMRVLVTDGMDAGAMEQLRKDGFEVVEQFYEPDQLGTALRDFDAVIIRSATKIKEPQIDAAKGSRLKLIIRAGVGVDNIAVKYAEAAGIQVKNTPRASSNAVAELAIALLFSCARNISIAGHTMRENKWEKKAYSKGFELSGCNCLIDKDAQDPFIGSSNLRVYAVKVYKATAENSPFGNPVPCGIDGTEIIHSADDPRLQEWLPDYEGRA